MATVNSPYLDADLGGVGDVLGEAIDEISPPSNSEIESVIRDILQGDPSAERSWSNDDDNPWEDLTTTLPNASRPLGPVHSTYIQSLGRWMDTYADGTVELRAPFDPEIIRNATFQAYTPWNEDVSLEAGTFQEDDDSQATYFSTVDSKVGISYFNSPEAVFVDLQEGVGYGGAAQGDTYSADVQRVWGSQFHDILIGDTETNRLVGDQGNDVFHLGGGDSFNRVWGGDGNDTLYAADNATAVFLAGRGVDAINGSDMTERMVFNFNADTTGHGLGGYTLDGVRSVIGGSGNDSFVFDASRPFNANNRVDGGDGDDYFSTYQGVDTIIGGEGDDSYRTGTGADVVRLAEGDGDDLWYDYVAGEDTIELDAASYTYNTATDTIHFAGGSLQLLGDTLDTDDLILV